MKTEPRTEAGKRLLGSLPPELRAYLRHVVLAAEKEAVAAYRAELRAKVEAALHRPDRRADGRWDDIGVCVVCLAFDDKHDEDCPTPAVLALLDD